MNNLHQAMAGMLICNCLARQAHKQAPHTCHWANSHQNLGVYHPEDMLFERCKLVTRQIITRIWLVSP